MAHLSRTRAVCLTLLATIIAGCAGTGTVPEDDRWEGFNRGMYAFNTTADNILLKPVAKGYRIITPDPVERGVSNIFANLRTPAIIVNQLLQGKGKDAASDTGRFLVNSTIGIVGIFDVATKFGLEEHNEDWGQTLAKWGVPSGPYLMLPFLGPSTLRDSFSTAADFALPVRRVVGDTGIEDKMLVLNIISARAAVLPLEEQLNAANDPYIFLREAYLQRRNFLIYDGNPPRDEEEFEIEDDFDEGL